MDAYTGEVIANEKVSISGTYNKTAVYWDMKQSGGSISLSTSKTITTDANGIATLNNVNFYPGLLLTNSAIYAPAGEYEVTVSGIRTLDRLSQHSNARFSIAVILFGITTFFKVLLKAKEYAPIALTDFPLIMLGIVMVSLFPKYSPIVTVPSEFSVV